MQSILLFGTIILALYVGIRMLGTDSRGGSDDRPGRCVYPQPGLHAFILPICETICTRLVLAQPRHNLACC